MSSRRGYRSARCWYVPRWLPTSGVYWKALSLLPSRRKLTSPLFRCYDNLRSGCSCVSSQRERSKQTYSRFRLDAVEKRLWLEQEDSRTQTSASTVANFKAFSLLHAFEPLQRVVFLLQLRHERVQPVLGLIERQSLPFLQHGVSLGRLDQLLLEFSNAQALVRR